MDATHFIESHVNATRDGMIGEETYPVEGTVFEDMSPGEAYRWCVKEYGRCSGKVYVDHEDRVLHVGWVFQSRKPYQDDTETYLHETWVTFLKRLETTTVREYVDLS